MAVEQNNSHQERLARGAGVMNQITTTLDATGTTYTLEPIDTIATNLPIAREEFGSNFIKVGEYSILVLPTAASELDTPTNIVSRVTGITAALGSIKANDNLIIINAIPTVDLLQAIGAALRSNLLREFQLQMRYFGQGSYMILTSMGGALATSVFVRISQNRLIISQDPAAQVTKILSKAQEG